MIFSDSALCLAGGCGEMSSVELPTGSLVITGVS
jgi:hypothetical protein